MIPTRSQRPWWFLVLLGPLGLFAGELPDLLQIRRQASQTEVFLPTDPVPPVVGTRLRLGVERSSDLQQWQPGPALHQSEDSNAPWKLALEGDDTRGFYRLQTEVLDADVSNEGAELLGYNRVFATELRQIGYLSVDDFQARFSPAIPYLTRLDFDPTTAHYWTELNTDTVAYNAALPPNSPDRRLHDFRLNAEELARFRANGFVVSERLGSYSFADVYYQVFADDFPVFISADSVLHAWHWSYQATLSELEELQITQAYESFLANLTAALPTLYQEVGEGPLRESVLDADYLLTVAQSLLEGSPKPSVLGQDARVAETLHDVDLRQYRESFALWGTNHSRPFDFSQFNVRGHYTRSARLSHYFQAVTWTALADLRVAGRGVSLRQLGTAVVLDELQSRSGAPLAWETVDELLRVFIGRVDSMSFRELGPLRKAAGLTLAVANQAGRLEQFQAELLAGNWGVATYASSAYPTPFSREQTQLPRRFTLAGKRFIPDGWATAQVTFDRILWNEELPDDRTFFGKVVRRLPTALDVAFSVLGNEQIAPAIADGIRENGLPYQHNLAAIKATFDQQNASAWQESIYARWLYALRMLSSPTTTPQYPQALRTRAWANKTLNTQLASWTQLRHDTVLYAAQPYAGILGCEYPAGYVEPRVEFWEAMRQLATHTADTIERFPAHGFIWVPRNSGEPQLFVDLPVRQATQVAHFRNFASVMTKLRDLAAKELAGVPPDATDTAFVRGTMNNRDLPYFGKTFDGWYPGLFYKDYGQVVRGGADINASDRRDLLATDVHSAPPDLAFTGSVLHEAVGDVDLLLIAVDCGSEVKLYLGPTLSHYEFIEPGLSRVNDQGWAARLDAGKVPPRPPWTQNYLVPVDDH